MDLVKVGKRLVSLRDKKSQKEVASALQISISAVSMYENGNRMPKDEIKKKFAEYYGTTVEKIFYA